MKLHLPKALLTTVVAACMAVTTAQAEDTASSSTYTYCGTVYTLDASTAHTSSDSGTLSTNVYETTKSTEDPSAWEQSTTAIVTTNKVSGTNTGIWETLFYEDDYNTLRITDSATYGYKFNGMTVGGFIVEDNETDAESIISALDGSQNSDRNITIGKADDSANSYFGESFAIEAKSSKTLESTIIKMQGTQAWHIADDKTVTIDTKGSIQNIGNWTVNGGTLCVNKTIQNSETAALNGTDTTLYVSDILSLDGTWGNIDASLETLNASNGLFDIERNVTVISGGSTNFTQFSYTDHKGIVQTVALSNGKTSISIKSYGVVTTSTLAEIKDAVEAGDTISIAIKEGVTLSAGSGVTFSKNQHLIGTGVYDLGSITSVDYSNIEVADFTGTIKATTGKGDLNLTGFNVINRGAKLQLSGFTGYLCSSTSNGGTLKTNLILEKSNDQLYALKLENGTSTSDKTSTFTGSIEGEGDMAFTWKTDSERTQTHIFQGDTSGWKGKFVRDADDNSKITVVKFTHGGDVFHADGTGGILNKNATDLMSVVIDSNEDTTFNGSITNVKSVDVNSNTSFEQQVSTGKLTVANSVTLGVAAGIETNELILDDDATLEFDGGSITIATNYEVDAACIVLAEGITFDSEEDYTLITVGTPAASEIAALSDATLTVYGWETWSGNGSVYTINNVDYTAKMALDGTSLKIKFTASIPEPTTATLSLLALAGLAARRRRRK